MKPPRFLVAGAGIGGLTTALALLRKGFDVDVYEQAQVLTEFGAGIQVSANAARVLVHLGLGSEIERIGSRMEARENRLWNTGEAFHAFSMGNSVVEKYGFAHFTAHRADLQAMLAAAVEAAKPGALHLKSRCVDVAQQRSGATLTLESGERIEGDAIVGVDGIHSVVRQRLFGEDRPRFTGCVAWRGLAPAPKLRPDLLRPVATNWLGKGAHVFMYPVRKGEYLNMFGVLERDDWRVESWSVRGTHEECLADFAGWHEDLRNIIRNVEVPYKWALMVHEPLQQWSIGRITLLGDACHSALPYLAQGAAMAIEDAMLLARSVEQYGDDIPRAFGVYEAARVERTTGMVRLTAAQLEAMHSPALAEVESGREHIAKEHNEQREREKLDWLYRYDAVNVPLPAQEKER
jgi:salicylate hydroxylase